MFNESNMSRKGDIKLIAGTVLNWIEVRNTQLVFAQNNLYT